MQTDDVQWKDPLLILLGSLLSLSLVLHIPLIIRSIQYRDHLKLCLPPVDERRTPPPSNNDGFSDVDLNAVDDSNHEHGHHGAAAALLGISNNNYVAPSNE